MHLDNPFSKETRELFRDVWVCWECGQNGQETGGLELHHITGRDSDSAYNAAILCKECHSMANHNYIEESKYTVITVHFLNASCYTPSKKDIDHLINHPRLMTPELKEWTDKQKKHYA
jgi:hypothetical protein